MFESVQLAPPDSILGLTEAFRNDSNPNKINLSVGVYQNEEGQTPILESVHQAEEFLLKDEKSKGYLGIDGLPAFRTHVPRLIFDRDSDFLTSGRVTSLQTPGGTGSLRVVGDLLHTLFPHSSIWVSQPTWANHKAIFNRAGLEVGTYAFLHENGHDLDFDAMLESIKTIPAGDAICLHACCHNPTGIDPTREQWEQIANVLAERNILPVFDFAYQGFGDGLEEDAFAIRCVADKVDDMLICSSYSKNFGLYGERIGALTLVTGSVDTTVRLLSQTKTCIRANYSNPPKHGAAIVATVLENQDLYGKWIEELTEMRTRIRSLREQFVAMLKEKAPSHDFSYITSQKGMFSYSGLNAMQVDQLKKEHSIYIVGSGRINIAGINSTNMEPLCDAIASVI